MSQQRVSRFIVWNRGKNWSRPLPSIISTRTVDVSVTFLKRLMKKLAVSPLTCKGMKLLTHLNRASPWILPIMANLEISHSLKLHTGPREENRWRLGFVVCLYSPCANRLQCVQGLYHAASPSRVGIRSHGHCISMYLSHSNDPIAYIALPYAGSLCVLYYFICRLPIS